MRPCFRLENPVSETAFHMNAQSKLLLSLLLTMYFPHSLPLSLNGPLVPRSFQVLAQRLFWYQFATSVLNQTPFYQLLRDIYIVAFAGEVHVKILSPLEPFMSYHKKKLKTGRSAMQSDIISASYNNNVLW